MYKLPHAPKSSGFTLVGTLAALVIGVIVMVAVTHYFSTLNKGFQYYSALDQRNNIYQIYSKIISKPEIRKASAKANSALQTYLKSSTPPAITSGPLLVLNPKGKTLIPIDGIYLDHEGRPASSSDYFWHVSANWSGLAGSSFSISLNVTKRPGAQIAGLHTLRDKMISIAEPTHMECFRIKNPEGHVAGPGVASAYAAFVGYMNPVGKNEFGEQLSTRPADSQYTRVRVTCPAGTRMIAIRAHPGCGSTNDNAYPLVNDTTLTADEKMRTGECRQFMADPGDAWCGGDTNIIGLECEATCCQF